MIKIQLTIFIHLAHALFQDFGVDGWSQIKISAPISRIENPIHIHTRQCPRLDRIFIWLGPAPPTPLSLTGLPARTCVGTLSCWEPM